MRRRGQLALVAIVAFALVVAVVLYAVRSRSGSDAQAAQARREAGEASEASVKLDAALSKLLEDAVLGACEEVALHAGQRAEALPPLRYGPTPYWFVRGNATTIPSADQVASAVEAEAAARVEEALPSLVAEHPGVSVSRAEVRLRYADEARIAARLGADVADAAGRASRLEVDADVPVRILLLRRLAHEYVEGHRSGRRLEKSLGHLIIEDRRIFAPNSPPEFGCQEEVVTAEEVRRYIAENMVLAVSEELSVVRQSPLQQPAVRWSLEFERGDLSVAVLDQRGDTDKVVKEVVSFGTKCFRVWKAFYNVTLPLRLTVIDTLPISRVRGESVLTARPLEFKAAVELAVADNVPFEGPSLASPVCKGRCSLELALREGEGPGEAAVTLGPCPLGAASGLYREVPCGTHTLRATKGGYAPAERTVVLRDNETATAELALEPYGGVSGSVYRRKRTYCTRDSCQGMRDRLMDEGLERLGYVKGNPPSFVTVTATSLSSRESFEAVADEEGRFSIGRLVPGDYLVVAEANRDSAGATPFKVQTYLGSLRVTPGEPRLHDVVMEPIVPVQVSGRWEFVSRTDACC